MTPKRLTKWLRDSADEIDNGGPFYSKSVPLRKAASALEEQAAEIAELREALKPFAALADAFNGRTDSDSWVVHDRYRQRVTFGDLRTARAKLEGSGA